MSGVVLVKLERAALIRREIRAHWWSTRGRWLAWGGSIGVVVSLIASLSWVTLHAFGPSPGKSESERRARTMHLVRKLTYERYPQWLAAQGWYACPTAADLAALAPDTAEVDAWHRKLQVACVPRLVHGPSDFLVRSAGHDGVFGTDDDLVARWTP